MGKKSGFIAVLSLLIVLFLVFAGFATSTASGPGSGGISVDSIPPEITIVSPDSIAVGDSLLEYYLLSYPYNKLEIGEPVGPSFQGLIDFLDPDDLKMLAEGTWFVAGSKHNYEQFLHFDEPLIKVRYLEDDNSVTSLFLNIPDNQRFVRYQLFFNGVPVSVITDADGNSAADGEYLWDFQGTTINILGKEYVVDSAIRPAAEKTASIELVLTDSSGNDTLILRDDDVTDGLSTHELVVNDETIYGAGVIISGTDNDIEFSLGSVELNLNSLNDYFVPAGGKLSDVVVSTGDQKELLLNGLLDMEYRGLTEEKTHDLKLQSPSPQKYELAWYDGDGNQVTMPIVYAEAEYDLSLGEESWDQASRTDQKRLILQESVPIWKNDYFVITGGNPEDGTAKSYLFQYLGSDNVNATEPKIRFLDVGDGNILYFDLINDSSIATINAGGFSFIVENASDAAIDDFQIFVDLNTIIIPQEPIEYPSTEFLYEGESEVYTLDGDEYEIALLFTGSNGQAKFSVNGEATPLMNEDESVALSGGIEITLNEVTYQDFAGGVHAASFNFQKIPVTDHTGITEEKVPIIDSYGSQWSFDWNVETSASPENSDYVALTQTTPNEDDYDNIPPEEITLYITAFNGLSASVEEIELLNPENETALYGYTSMGAFIVFDPAAPAEFTMTYPEKQLLPLVYVTGMSGTDHPGVALQVTTDEYAACNYQLYTDAANKPAYSEMQLTKGASHLQNLFNLQKGEDYEASVECTDKYENTNTELINFHYGDDFAPPQITFQSPQEDSIVTEEMLSDIVIYGTESWRVGTEDNILEYEEPVSSIRPVIGSDELTALADGSWSVNEFNYAYKQLLSFDTVNSDNQLVTYMEDDDDVTDDFFVVRDNQPIATYRLEFISPAQTEIDSKILTGFQGTTLTLFGKDYFVFKAERPALNSVKLILKNDAETMVLRDEDITDEGSSYEVMVNGEAIDGADVKITGTDDGSILSISSLEVKMIAQDDYYVAAGETLSGQPELSEKELIFTQNWDFKYDGLDPIVPLYDILIHDQSGEKEYWLTFTNIEGNKIKFPIAYADGGNSIILGSQDDRLKLENSNIAYNQYFILNNGTDKDAVSNVIQYKDADGHMTGSGPKMKFKILATGETVEIPIIFEYNGGWVATASLELADVSYTITSVEDTSQDDYNISITGGVDTHSSNPYGPENYVIAKGGAKINIAENEIYSNTKSIKVSVNLIDPDGVDDSINVSPEDPYLVSSVDIIAFNNVVDFTNYAGITLWSPDGDVDNAYGYAPNGAWVKLNSPYGPGTDSDTIEIEWPENQRVPLVYVTATIKNGTEKALPLEVSTDENAVCSYSLGGDYQPMETTGAISHSQNLFDLEEGDHQISVQCVDESGNSDTEVLNFYFGEVPEPVEEPSAPAPSRGGGSSSSKPKVSTPIVVSQSEEDEEINYLPEEKESLPTNTAKSIQSLSELPAEVSLGKGEKAYFTIGDNNYGVWADKIDDGSLFLTINSKPEPTVAVLKLSESRNFDLNGDGEDDISISLTETDGLKAYLRIANIKPSLSSRLTAAVVGVTEKGGLIYVAGLVLAVFSLVGIKIFYNKK